MPDHPSLPTDHDALDDDRVWRRHGDDVSTSCVVILVDVINRKILKMDSTDDKCSASGEVVKL